MRYYDHIHQINDKQQLLLLLDSQKGLNVPDYTPDNDFSLWSIHSPIFSGKSDTLLVLFAFICLLYCKQSASRVWVDDYPGYIFQPAEQSVQTLQITAIGIE